MAPKGKASGGGRQAKRARTESSNDDDDSKQPASQRRVSASSIHKEATKSSSSKSTMTIDQKCDWIAELSESIMEDPSTAFTSTKEPGSHEKSPSKVRQLLDMANVSKSSGEHEYYTARLAILSLLALFQDILPSYRIRLPTAAEMAVKVSKDTKQLWDYERALLSHYQQYLKILERAWERRGSDTSSPLSVAAMLCLCELLKAAPHFNFRSNILTLVVRQMNNRECEEVADACCAAVEHLFANDPQGEIALEAARLVAKLTKDRHFRVRPAVLRTFLALPLRVHVDEAEAAKLAAAANAKKRKRNREEAEIEKEIQEGSSAVDKIVLARCQSETLQVVTLTYFRILKSEDLSTDHIAELLPPALEGLAKFAHLINIDTVTDVLAVLKTLLKRVDDLPLDASLNCILTAFQTLQGPGRELKIDQKEYITPLYSQLPRLVHSLCTVLSQAIRAESLTDIRSLLQTVLRIC
jgi:nucleolar complex protein 3